MRIIKLMAENVKRISAISVTPEGNTVTIGGKNAAGKSSVLDSIMYAFGGKATYPKSLIKDGEDQAVITIEVEGYTVERTIRREKADKLKITAENGMTDTKESFLRDLCGSIGLAFDPSAFVREESKKQLKILKEITGLDFTDLEQKRAAIYSARTEINSLKKAQEGTLETLAIFPEAPEKEIISADLMTEYDQAVESCRKIEKQEHDISIMRDSLKDFDRFEADAGKDIMASKQMIDSLQAQIEDHKKRIKTTDQEIAQNEAEKQKHIAAGKAMAVELEAIKAAAIDPAPIKERMAKAEEINRQVRANRTYKETEAKAAEYKKQADDLTKQIEAIDEDKEKQLKAAKFPVDGLSFDSEGVLYNGVPFGQASQAERIRVSVSIAAALNPKLRIALIRDGSLLDSESMKLLNELAAEKDMQIWIESVMDEKEPGCIFIEDGSAI